MSPATNLDSDFGFADRTTAMLLVGVHQFNLALQLLVEQPLVFEVEFDLFLARILTNIALVQTAPDKQAGGRQ